MDEVTTRELWLQGLSQKMHLCEIFCLTRRGGFGRFVAWNDIDRGRLRRRSIDAWLVLANPFPGLPGQRTCEIGPGVHNKKVDL
jgi:hypothetical protein